MKTDLDCSVAIVNLAESHPEKENIDQADVELCLAAMRASKNAYAPYSNFSVGAAVRTIDGIVYSGSNLENASYGLGICAEVSAIANANSSGNYNIEAIAIYGFNDEASRNNIITPCGRCRQLIKEAADNSGKDIRVICCSENLKEVKITGISSLLPEAFNASNISDDSQSVPFLKRFKSSF